MTTATFLNLDYNLFDQHMADARFLNLKLVSWRVEDNKWLNLELKGDDMMLKTFDNWLYEARNWTEQALEDAKIMREAEYYLGGELA